MRCIASCYASYALLHQCLHGSQIFDEDQISPWTPPLLTQCCPSGAPGLDGWTADATRALDHVNAICLCALLDDCNMGLFPACFRQARCVGIPKGDGALDRRPLTVMSIMCRRWASRMASYAGEWMHIYMSPTI